MRRWNGWGDTSIDYPLPAGAADFLETRVGAASPPAEVSLEDVLACVPASRLAHHPLITTDSSERLLHARGQSLPDWVALRSGQIECYPDGVAFPSDEVQVRDLLDYAKSHRFQIIIYGGGTSVVGHVTPLPGNTAVLTIDMSRMTDLVQLDETSRQATFKAGVSGPYLESQLNQHGFTLGHFPQSFELSTLGGWIATRSCGQQSYRYGRIEDLFAGGHLETLAGPLELPALPASAAGPDLRHIILGSEGRLGIITRATVRIRLLPEFEAFYGIFFHEWESGQAALRQIAQIELPVSMLRLSDAQETETTLVLSGKKSLVNWADRSLKSIGYSSSRCLLILGITGDHSQTRYARQKVFSIVRRHGGLPTGQFIGKTWKKSRFLTPYLRNTLWDHGYALDTMETAVKWADIDASLADIQSALRTALTSDNERVLVFSHLSHVYVDGASIYTTFLFRQGAESDETLQRWLALKTKASLAVVAHGGTISHQHGVGIDHAPYLKSEKGSQGIAALHATFASLDPDGLLNPGKLIK